MMVLIVEDERDARDTLQDAFEDEGYVVGVAGNGVEALAVLANHTPDLVLLDLVMPLMTGNEVYEAMKADPRWASIPIVITTSDPARAPSGALVIRKPLNLRNLLGLAKQLTAP